MGQTNSAAEIPAGAQSPKAPPQTSDTAARLEALYPDDVPPAEEVGDAARAKPADGKDDAAPAKPEDESEKRAPAESSAPYDLKMPDGVPLDQELLGAATPILREAGLTNEQASKLIPLVETVQARFEQQQQDGFGQLKKHWANQAKADRELGGKNWDETIKLAALALGAGGAHQGSEVRELLNDSGLGNHPAFIRLFRQLGAKLKAAGVGPTAMQTRINRIKSIYPND